MKKCNTCGIAVEDAAGFCPKCGSTDLAVSAVKAANSENGNGNIIAGVVGAFLFSLIGALLYFVVYQIGFVAGICGLAIFVLAGFGYRIFAGTKNPNSVAGLIVSVIIAAAMIFVSEYICISYEIFVVFKEEVEITFFDAVRATPEFLAEPEIRSAVIEDLLFSYVFGFIAIIGNIVNIVKAKKQAAAVAAAPAPAVEEKVSNGFEEPQNDGTASTLE